MLELEKTETERILEWRQLQLERAGLAPMPASQLALAPVDLEFACRVVRLVLAAGKPYTLAVEILL